MTGRPSALALERLDQRAERSLALGHEARERWDVVLFNITAIVGFRWISVAAAGGNTSMTLWIAALAFFFLPQALAVMELTRRMPVEGGVYSWARSVFGDFHGFMAGWCYWTNNLVYFPNLLVYLAGISVFMAGSSYQELGESKPYVMAFSLLAILAEMTAVWRTTLERLIAVKKNGEASDRNTNSAIRLKNGSSF